MRFLMTINTPSANSPEYSTHQMIVDHPAGTQEEMCDILNNEEFVVFQVFYRRKNLDGSIWWQDRGKAIINTSWITKAQEFIDLEATENPRRRL